MGRFVFAIRTLLLGILGSTGIFLYAKDHELPLTGDVSDEDSGHIALACADESQAEEDELYFISCGGIY